jgi:hypothetical protein
VEKTLIIEEQRLNKNFTQIPNEVLFYDKLTPQARLLYAILVSFAWFENECWPGQTRLAEAMGCSEKMIRKYLNELREHDLVEWKRREGAVGLTNVYFIRPLPRQVIEYFRARNESIALVRNSSSQLVRKHSSGLDRNSTSGVVRNSSSGKEYSVMKNTKTSITVSYRNTPSGCEGIHHQKKDESSFKNELFHAEKLESSETFSEEDELSEQETFTSEYENGTVPQNSTSFQPGEAGLSNEKGRLFGYETRTLDLAEKKEATPPPHSAAPLPSEERGEAGGATWRDSLNRWEKEVVHAYEYYTGKTFCEQELPLLKEALAVCPPSGIVRGIAKHPNPREVNSFSYFMTLIKRGVFGRRRKSPKGGEKVGQKYDPRGYRNYTDEQVAEWEKRFERLRAQRTSSNERLKDEN